MSDPVPRPSTATAGSRRRWLWFVLSAVLLYSAIVLMLALLQRKLIYFPTRELDVSPASEGLGDHVVSIRCRTDDGLVLNGWHWRGGTHPERPAVLFFHGNGGNRRHRVDDYQQLARCGADVIIFDYRGYGDNEGRPTEDGFASDARAVWTYTVDELGFDPQQIVLFGGSLGGGVAVGLAAEKCAEGTPPGGLILRSTFSSLVDAAKHHYPWLPVRQVLVDRYPSIDRAAALTCPVLQFHGTSDNIVPYELGRRLFDALPTASASGRAPQFVSLEGVGHNVLPPEARRQIGEAIREFLATIP